jgi:NifU-like protein
MSPTTVKAGGGCGMCHERIQKIIDKVRGDRALACARRIRRPRALTNLQKIKLIEEIVEREINPG